MRKRDWWSPVWRGVNWFPSRELTPSLVPPSQLSLVALRVIDAERAHRPSQVSLFFRFIDFCGIAGDAVIHHMETTTRVANKIIAEGGRCYRFSLHVKSYWPGRHWRFLPEWCYTRCMSTRGCEKLIRWILHESGRPGVILQFGKTLRPCQV